LQSALETQGLPKGAKSAGSPAGSVVAKEVNVSSVHTGWGILVSHTLENKDSCFTLKANAPLTIASTASPVKNIFAFFIKNAAFWKLKS
jgi:hypothetical protein